jgi:hypothetical protein
MIDFHLLNTLQKLAMKREITLFSSDRWFTSKCRSFIADSKSSVSIFVRRHFRVNFNASYIREKFKKTILLGFFPLTWKKDRTIPVTSKVRCLIHSSERCWHWFESARNSMEEYGKWTTRSDVVIWREKQAYYSVERQSKVIFSFLW